MLDRRCFITSSTAACAAMLPGLRGDARAQAVKKSARLLVGFPAGGSSDTVARLLVDRMTGYAPSIVVDNRPGAGGRLALEAVKASEPDGATLALTPGDQLTLFPHVYKSLAYDAMRDFVPVTTVCSFPFVLTIGPMVPPQVRSVHDFIAWCRDNPRSATYGSPGAGTRPHFLGVALSQSAEFEFVHLPYKGFAPLTQDLLGGQIPAAFTVLSNALPLVEAGQLRALATTSPRRTPLTANVPTFAEVGFPVLKAIEWFGILVAARTPAPIVAALRDAIGRAVQSDPVKAGFAKLAFEPALATADQFADLIRADTERWGPIVRASGFKPIE